MIFLGFNLSLVLFPDRPVSITRQPSDRRSAGGPTLSSQASVSATDNGNTSAMHHQGSFSSPKNGAAHSSSGLPSTVTDALAAQGIDISASFKEAERQQQHPR